MKHYLKSKLLGVAALLMLYSTGLAAQSKPAAQPAAKKPVSGSITAGSQFESGTTNLRGIDISGRVEFPYSIFGDFVVQSQYRYGRTTIHRGSETIVRTIADFFHVRGGVDHYIGKYGVLMSRTGFTNDEIQDIHHRVEQMTGFGVRLSKERKVTFRFVPGISILDENKGFTGDKGFDVGAGFFQDIRVQLNPTWTFDQHFLYRHDFDLESDFAMEGSASLTGRITNSWGVQLSFQHNHENLVRPGGIKRYQNLTAGLQYRF